MKDHRAREQPSPKKLLYEKEISGRGVPCKQNLSNQFSAFPFGRVSHAYEGDRAQASTPVSDINITMLSSHVLFLPNAFFELH